MLSPAGLPAAERKVILLKSKDIPPFQQAAEGFKRCLTGKGVPASFQEIVLPEDPGQADATFHALAGGKPDLVLSIGTQATRLAREKLRGIPVVFCMVIDPAANEWVKSGVSMDPPPESYIEYIHQNFPKLKRIGVLCNSLKSKDIVQHLKDADAETHTLVFQEVANISGLDAALKSLKTKADCLLMTMDPGIYNPQTAGQIILQTLQMDLPLIAVSPAFVKGGALAALYADPMDNGCQAADLAAKALEGDNLAALPLLPPRKVNSAINLIVADRLRIAVPAGTRAAAEQVVQ